MSNPVVSPGSGSLCVVLVELLPLVKWCFGIDSFYFKQNKLPAYT